MPGFVLRRLASAIPTIFIVVTISFFLMRFAPGGPFNLERALPPQIMANMLKAYQLDQPLYMQYLHYLWNVLHGDFGPSYVYRDFSVAELIGQSLPYSLELGSWAMLARGRRRRDRRRLRRAPPERHRRPSGHGGGDGRPDGAEFRRRPDAVAGLRRHARPGSRPAAGDRARSRDLVLPVIALGLPQLGVFARLTRGSMIETLRADHIRTARAYGLPPRAVVVVHALRGALLPVVTYLAPCAAAVLTGSVVIETIFAIPGVGRYFVLGAINRDYTLVMGTVVLVAVFIIVFNLIVDMLYAVLDPRVRYD